jgi:outer membrane protein
MKKTMTILCAVAVLALMGANSQAAEAQQLAFVDLDKVFNEHPKTKQADAQLKEQGDAVMKERKELIDDYEKLQEEFNAAREEAQNTALSEEKRDEKRTEAEDKLVSIRELEAKIRRFDESRRKQLDEQSRRMRKGIVEEIRKVIHDYSVKQNFLAVVDSSGQSFNGVEIILYTDPKVDITDTIIAELTKTTGSTGETKSAPAKGK